MLKDRSQWAPGAKMTSYQRRCDVITSHRRRYDATPTSRARWDVGSRTNQSLPSFIQVYVNTRIT